MTLFFYIFVGKASAGELDIDTTISGYVAKMAISLVVLVLFGLLALKILPGKLRMGAQGRMKTMGVLPLGRDVLYLVQVGPDVVSIFVTRAGRSEVVGKWSGDEWSEYERAREVVDGKMQDAMNSKEIKEMRSPK